MSLVIALAGSACSGGSDDATEESADAAQANDPTEASSDAGFAIACEEAGKASGVLAGGAQAMGQLDAETEDLFALDYDKLLGAIETLRQIEDVDGLFGTMSDSLDNLEADVLAIQDKRYDDMVGEYGVLAMNTVIVEEIC